MLSLGYLVDNFRTVRMNTLTIAKEIPDHNYSFVAAPGVKTVAEMLAHVAVLPRWQTALHREGTTAVDFAMFAARTAKVKAEEEALRTKEQIVEALEKGGEQFAAFLSSLSPTTLEQTVSFPPPIQPATKTRFEMLLSVKEHEMHHRAQLMLIERMIGIVPHITRQREAFAAQARA